MISAKLIEVIETVSTRGKGVDGDPIREVIEYWSKDGVKLAEHDNWEWRMKYCEPTTLLDCKEGE